MSEELNPCPCCGGTKSLFFYDYPTGAFAICCANCGMRGPVTGYSKDGAAAAWNFLPRDLQWTTGTPTKRGWYWQRRDKEDTPLPMRVVDVSDLPANAQWAGPIPQPKED